MLQMSVYFDNRNFKFLSHFWSDHNGWPQITMLYIQCLGRKFWGIESVKILVILNPAGYMFTSSGFAFIHNNRATPKNPTAEPTKSTSPTYSPGIHGWDLSWMELLVARLCPSSSHSNSSSQDKSQPSIPGEYVGLVLLHGGAASIFGGISWGTFYWFP